MTYEISFLACLLGAVTNWSRRKYDPLSAAFVISCSVGALLSLIYLTGCKPTEHGEMHEVPPTYPDQESGIWFSKPVTPSPTPVGWIKIQTERWNKAQIKPEKVHFVEAITAQIERSRKRYDTVAATTGVPWQVIASIHNMECGLSFRQNLANGDPLTAKTRHVPRGRPPGDPPFTWEQGAVDSLKYDHLDKKPWGDIGSELQNVELYNGSGYQRYHPNIPSPYLWSWTNIYTRGKYVADGTWSDTAISEQCGVSPILKTLNAKEK